MNIKMEVENTFTAILGLFLLMYLVSCAGTRPSINKCCPENQRLDVDLNCVEEDSSAATEGTPVSPKTNRLLWFPLDAIVDSKTLNIHDHLAEDYLNVIVNKYRVNYGLVPECGESDTRQFAYHKRDLVEWFNFIIDEDDVMSVHVSKPSSYHDPEKSLPFPRISNESERLHHTISRDIDSVRSLPLEDACVDLGIEDIYVLIFCPCRTLLCIRRCCPEDHHFSIASFACVENESDDVPAWRPKTDGLIENYYLLSDTYPSCDVPMLLKYHHEEYSTCNRYNKASDNDFVIFGNGSLKVRKYNKLFDTSQYCGEVTISENGTIEEQNLILCSAAKEEDSYKPITHTLYGVLLVVGGLCLLVTVAVSLFLPSLRRKVHNKIALSHNASLMIANFTWAIPQLTAELSSKSCIVLAVLEQFTLLGSFFWLNVMCIDISMTFSSNRHLKSGRFDKGNKKFAYYCTYAWGSTALISIATIAMEYNTDVTLDYLKPGFTCICGFNTENASMLIYLYGPMTILLLVNLILFVYTTIKIMNIQKQTAMLHKSDSNTSGGSSFQTDKQRYDPVQW